MGRLCTPMNPPAGWARAWAVCVPATPLFIDMSEGEGKKNQNGMHFFPSYRTSQPKIEIIESVHLPPSNGSGRGPRAVAGLLEREIGCIQQHVL